MRFAAIDVGSNTLRLLIADIRDNILSRIYADRTITRLAQGIGNAGVLRQQNMETSVSALKDFSCSVTEYGVTRVKAVGTSALRDAANSRAFVDRVFQETGMGIEIITGIREAELTLKGILLGSKETDGSLIIDIGGGSTEWILHGKGSSPSLSCGSLPAGVVNLSERFIRTDPPSPDDISSLNKEIDAQLLPLRQVIAEQALSLKDFIGTGGTITTLASMDLQLKEYDADKVHLHKIPSEGLSRLRDMLVTRSLESRKEIRGLEPDRADLIIPGVLLTIRFMDSFAVRELTVSDYGLLEGLVKEMNDENSL